MVKKQLLSAENIQKSYGEQMVLDFQRFQVYEGDKIGLVGANGVGKTTLLRILSGEILADCGSIQRNCEPFYFKQFSDSWDSYDIDMAEAGRLGVSEQLWQGQVSGGENTRIRLAELFGTPRALAFLDEPSANLDRMGIQLLKKKLDALESFVLVSHDRALMNAVCNKIAEISFGKIEVFTGNYDNYQQQKQAQTARQQLEYELYQNERKRLQSIYLDKKKKAVKLASKPKNISSSDLKDIGLAATKKPEDKVKSMERSATNVLKRIKHLEVKEKPREIPAIRPDFRLTQAPENPIVIRGEKISFGYHGDLLCENVDFILYNHSKVAICGSNGAGKTTLLNLMVQSAVNQENGEPTSDFCSKEHLTFSGKITVVPKARIGYVKQNLSSIDWNKTVLENVMSVSIQKESIARIILARLLLTEQDMNKVADTLSGGERIKLSLAMLFVSDVNLLVLDEPTNYLDLPSIEALEKLLQEYEGTLLFVSHDQTFVEHIATEEWRLADGTLVNQIV